MNDLPAVAPYPTGGLERLLRRVARRSRLRRALEGALLALALLALAVAAAAWFIESERFTPAVVSTARWVVAIPAALLLVGWGLVVLGGRMDPQQAARYVERRAPGLDGVLVTAVLATRQSRAAGLWRGVVAQAVDACRRLDAIDGAERGPLRRAAGGLVALLVLIAATAMLAPAGLRHAAGLLVPWNDPLAPIPYRVEVSPGALNMVAGNDLRVIARMHGFRPREAMLGWRREGETGWRALPMLATGAAGFEGLLFELAASIEYRVQAEGVVSKRYLVTVLPRPAVERIDLTYHYPPASGRVPETQTDGGAIAAVRGTRVELRVLPRAPVAAARLVLDDQREQALQPGDDGAWLTGITLAVDGHYRVEFDAGDDRFTPASPEYPITAQVDTPPSVRIRRPGRDAQVTAIEELEIEVVARDDVIVRDLELVLSVNGGEDEILPLGNGPGAPALVASEILRLEERVLEAGDLLSFHARAADGEGEAANRASSDLYFLEVRPYDRVYRRAEGGGGGGGAGGGAGQQAGLAEQQRELVVALFNVRRDGVPDEQGLRERAGLLSQAQARVRDRTEAIVRRLGTRPVVEMNPGYRAMAAELPRAASAMLRVEALLSAREIGTALEPAREALRHLQRADAAFREVQVARQSGTGQGQAGAAEAGDLANLFALEMDRFRSQYAGVERGRWQQPGEQALDEVAEQLRRLAERQQREVERMRQRRLQSSAGAGGVASQQALEEEIERLERELQRLTLERPEQQALADALQRARAAARAMREAGQAGSETAAREALEQLRAARRAVEGARGEQLAGEVDQARARTERLAVEQRGLSESVAAGEAGDSLAEQKDDIAARLDALGAQVDRLASEARGVAAAGAARALREAADRLNDERLREGVRRTRERLARDADNVDPRTEAEIAGTLEEAASRLAEAAGQLGNEAGEGAGREDPAARLARLVEQLEAAQQRLAGGEAGAAQDDGSQPGEQGSASAGSQGGAAGGGAAAQGGAANGGAWSGGIASGGAGVGSLAPFRGNAGARARDLDRLLRVLPPDSAVARDIEAVVAGLLDIAEDELASPAHALERHAELLARLRRAREALAAAGAAGPPALLARQQGRAPVGWEALVEDYYRALAEVPR